MPRQHTPYLSLYRGLAWLTLVLLLAMGDRPAVAQPSQVNMGIQPFISYVPIFVALDQGMFGEQGLEVKTETFASSQKMTPGIASGQLDVVGGALSAAFYNSIATGLKMKIVADKGRWSKGHSITQFLVRRDLYENGTIKSVADLIGRKIVNNSPLTGPVYLLAIALKRAGGAYDHSKISYMEVPKIYQGLKSKAIEVGTCVEPWCSRAVSDGTAVSLIKGEDYPETLDFQVAYVIFTDKFISEKRETAQRFMNAYVRAVQFYHEKGEQSDLIAQIVSKHTKIPPAIVKAAAPTGIAPDAMPNIKSVADFQDWLYEQGFVKQKLEINGLWDPSFVKNATK
ncbi:MAG: ABC transporter substrate-binding protein [Candidatus Tectomicrobia bacterium]|nr:ABC transporter substrate-binding protein [Candidatus Tectomicrobia bacterium]